MGKQARKVTRARTRAERITEAERVELDRLARTVGQAQQRAQAAERARGDAQTRLDFHLLALRDRYRLGDGDQVNTDSGRITRRPSSP